MAVEAISATSAASITSVQDFLKILLTQLTFQDPLKPVDNQQFMAQLAQFTALEQTQQINSKIDSLIATQASLQSVGLLGKSVDATLASGPASGTVSAISLQDGVPTLTLTTANGATLTGVSFAQITAVR